MDRLCASTACSIIRYHLTSALPLRYTAPQYGEELTMAQLPTVDGRKIGDWSLGIVIGLALSLLWHWASRL